MDRRPEVIDTIQQILARGMARGKLQTVKKLSEQWKWYIDAEGKHSPALKFHSDWTNIF